MAPQRLQASKPCVPAAKLATAVANLKAKRQQSSRALLDAEPVACK
jgi:hypothetical protein